MFESILFLAGLATTLAGTAVSYRAQRQQAKQAQYNADYNARLEEREADEELQRRQEDERNERNQNRRRRASIEAAYAKSGLLMTGTPAYALEEQARTDEQNIQTKNARAQTSFNNSMNRASIIRQMGSQQADAYKTGATNTLISGVGSTLLQGATYAADNELFSTKKTPGATDNSLFDSAEGWV